MKQIADVHNHVRDRLAPGKARTRYADLHVRITGVGYFNRVTGRTGEAPNGIELSPVLSLEWLSDSGTSTRRAEKAKA